MPQVSFELKNLAVLSSHFVPSQANRKFWAKIIPKSVIDESARYCERFPKPKLFSFNWGIPSVEQVNAYQLALTVFGSDAVSGIDKDGWTVLTIDGQQLKLSMDVLDTMSSQDGLFSVSASSKDAARPAANSVLAYLKEHRYEDRMFLCLPWMAQGNANAHNLDDLPPGLDELDEDKLVAGSAN